MVGGGKKRVSFSFYFSIYGGRWGLYLESWPTKTLSKDTAFTYSYVSACPLLLHLSSPFTFSAQPFQQVLEHQITIIWPTASCPVTQVRASITVAASSAQQKKKNILHSKLLTKKFKDMVYSWLYHHKKTQKQTLEMKFQLRKHQ